MRTGPITFLSIAAATSALAATMLTAPGTCVSAATQASERPAPPPNTLTPEEERDGWRLLFDGRTLDQWRGYRKDGVPAGWSVQDGALALTGKAGDLVTREEFGDFELRLEWKISPGGNSGIFFHVTEGGDAVWESGPELQVLDNATHADGRTPKTSAGSNYALHAPSRDATRPVGQWNEVRLVVDGPRVEHWLNGIKVVDYALWSPEWEALVSASKFRDMPGYGRARRGHLALQDHGDPVWFRSIKVRTL